ncbi:hypothetical protein, partial [Stenotrophomonas forensis]|uniref:hypothetical protein n=1 Tax=Stenotrophomonas forensis TaxID=2871169 RepID=UPI0039C62F07
FARENRPEEERSSRLLMTTHSNFIHSARFGKTGQYPQIVVFKEHTHRTVTKPVKCGYTSAHFKLSPC